MMPHEKSGVWGNSVKSLSNLTRILQYIHFFHFHFYKNFLKDKWLEQIKKENGKKNPNLKWFTRKMVCEKGKDSRSKGHDFYNFWKAWRLLKNLVPFFRKRWDMHQYALWPCGQRLLKANNLSLKEDFWNSWRFWEQN